MGSWRLRLAAGVTAGDASVAASPSSATASSDEDVQLTPTAWQGSKSHQDAQRDGGIAPRVLDARRTFLHVVLPRVTYSQYEFISLWQGQITIRNNSRAPNVSTARPSA